MRPSSKRITQSVTLSKHKYYKYKRLKAAFGGHLAVAGHLATRGAEASAVDEDDRRPLHLADDARGLVRRGQVQCGLRGHLWPHHQRRAGARRQSKCTPFYSTLEPNAIAFDNISFTIGSKQSHDFYTGPGERSQTCLNIKLYK